MKKEEQAKVLPLRLDEPGFSWYKKNCCELNCIDCGIKARFDSTYGISSSTAASEVSDTCGCEFDCRDENGLVIDVAVKVKMYCEQERSGSFQKEMEEVVMTLPEFKEHFIKCAKKYLIHHFNDIMSSQARRNAYEKMMTDNRMSTTLLLASDYSAILDGHSQDQLNQTIQLHSIQLVILLSHLSSGVLVTKAYSFWTQQGISKLKSDNHFYRQCKDKVISDARSNLVPFDRIIEITDGAPSQFKNRFNMAQLCNLVKKYDLVWAMAVYPPTATFKGEHDGVGNLDKKVIKQAELAEVGRYPTTRSFMPLLWSQPAKTPRGLNDPARRTHEIDEHIRMLVVDFPDIQPNDEANSKILITNKHLENYDCTIAQGIQSSYNAIVFQAVPVDGVRKTPDTVFLRDAFCSCESCRGAQTQDDFENCR